MAVSQEYLPVPLRGRTPVIASPCQFCQSAHLYGPSGSVRLAARIPLRAGFLFAGPPQRGRLDDRAGDGRIGSIALDFMSDQGRVWQSTDREAEMSCHTSRHRLNTCLGTGRGGAVGLTFH